MPIIILHAQYIQVYSIITLLKLTFDTTFDINKITTLTPARAISLFVTFTQVSTRSSVKQWNSIMVNVSRFDLLFFRRNIFINQIKEHKNLTPQCHLYQLLFFLFLVLLIVSSTLISRVTRLSNFACKLHQQLWPNIY